MVHLSIEDIELTGTWEINITQRGDLGTVSGKRAFEQRVAHKLNERVYELIGNIDEQNIIDMLETRAERVAANDGMLEYVETFIAEPADDEVDTYNITIVWETGEEFTEMIGG